MDILNLEKQCLSSKKLLDANLTTSDKIEIPKDKCHVCSKKVGLYGFECRCKGVFCSKHRYNTDHNCSFDWKNMGRLELESKSVKLEPSKINKL